MRTAYLALVASLVLGGGSPPAIARPFGIEDLLRQESFGATAVDPKGRWLLFERADRYDRADRFDYDQQSTLARSRLFRVDLANPGPPHELPSGVGVTLGAFSPSGKRVAIYRLRGRSWTLGVADLARGRVRWLGITPERSPFGRTLQWRDDRRLWVIERPDDTPPFALRQGRASADALPALWAAAAAGRAAYAVSASGVYAARRPRPPPRRLLEVDVVSGWRRVLSSGEFTDLEVSPDTRHAALLEAGEDLQPRLDGPSQGDWGISTQAAHLVLIDLTTGAQSHPCGACDVLPDLLSWSPDSRALLIFARGSAESWRRGALRRIDVAGNASTVVGAGLEPVLRFRPELISAGWMGETPIVWARAAAPAAGEPAGRADWYRLTPDGPVNLTAELPEPAGGLSAVTQQGMAVLAGGGLWFIQPSGTASRAKLDDVRPLWPPSPVAGRVAHSLPATSWVTTAEAGRRVLQRVSPTGLRSIVSLPPDGRPVAVAERRRSIVTEVDSANGVAKLQVTSGGDRPLAAVNRHLADVDAIEAVPIEHPGPDGGALPSWLLLPPVHPAGARLPLVVLAYPGTVYRTANLGSPRPETFVTDPRMLLGRGYAVLEPSLPTQRGVGEPMRGLSDQILRIVDAVAARPDLASRVDVGTLGIWGHSFGGYGVMGVITQTDRFCAAVSIAGISDLTALWSALPVAHRVAPEEGSWSNWNTGNVESGQVAMGAAPWAAPERYDANSPFLAANRIHTPLLLAHGDQDLILLNQSEAMFSALYRQDKDALLLTYWGEGHFLASPGNLRSFYRDAFAFLDAHLHPSTRGGAGRDRSPGCASASGAPSSPSSPPRRSPSPPPAR